MKKTAITIITGLLAICGYAQTGYDAYLFSENNYEGTARSVAMGNAFTALGGDLGSIGINPAGSAVAGYSQISLTPSLTFSASTAQGVSPYTDGYLPYFQKNMRTPITRFNMPNMGIVMNFNTNRTSGLKNLTFGFIMNQTASYDEEVYTSGTNSTTSFMGAMAAEASNYYYDEQTNSFYGLSSSTELGVSNAYEIGIPWSYVMGYNSGMISPYTDPVTGTAYDDRYVGATEVVFDNGDIITGGALDQTYGRRVSGSKYDYIFNFGANFSDFVYFGVNIGFTSLDYSYRYYLKEAAVDPANFELTFDNNGVPETTYFKDMKYKYSQYTSGTGAYAKFGVIVTPGAGLRIGAAISTPTALFIDEEWEESGETTYLNSSYDLSDYTPYGEGEYKISSPFRANLGLAYTLGNFGAISADYEFCDYGQMSFKSNYYEDREFFEELNAGIRQDYRASHILRIGAEVKPLPFLAVRAGYGMATSPEEAVYQMDVSKIKTQNVSFGLGYNSKKSFFADLAVKGTFVADDYFMPYSDYIFDEEGYVAEDGFAPEICVKTSNWKVLFTLGWRF